MSLGTHMSIIKLKNEKFLIIDTIPMDDETKLELDNLTDGGKKIEAVVATHPFHTLSFPAFHKLYPDVPVYYIELLASYFLLLNSFFSYAQFFFFLTIYSTMVHLDIFVIKRKFLGLVALLNLRISTDGLLRFEFFFFSFFFLLMC
jgi:hypothetical protein